MKTKMILIAVLLVLGARLTAATIAVTNLSSNGLFVTPEMAAKMARLELVKIEKYTVLDEFDMTEVLSQYPDYAECYGKTCLVELGAKLKVDYVLSGSVDGLGNKIVVTIKLIDVVNGVLKSTRSVEFDNQEKELQRMLGIVIQEMHGIVPDEVIKTQLSFKNEVIVSNNVGRLNNTGPRMGVSYVVTGDLVEFYERKESQGGLDMLPVMTNLGYQFEGQYLGTENFSALAELIFNVAGMEQGRFLPSMSLLNGFRFGKSGWEVAFGPSFGIRTTSTGKFDDEGNYYRESQWRSKDYTAWQQNPANFDPVTGEIVNPYQALNDNLFSRELDTRGRAELNANWITAFGRTFRSGALNIPVNIYYSHNKYGGLIGASIGFNVNKTKKPINQP